MARRNSSLAKELVLDIGYYFDNTKMKNDSIFADRDDIFDLLLFNFCSSIVPGSFDRIPNEAWRH